MGIFLTSFISSASIIFPIPAFVIIPATAALPSMNPFIVTIFAGLGSALGESLGYGLGKGSKKIQEKKYSKQINRYRKMLEKGNIFIWIIIFAATPLPDDVIGIISGLMDYEFKKFFIATLIGKILLNLFLALGGFYLFQQI